MALNIKDPETDDLVRRLAQRTGESITVATKIAVQERLARLNHVPPRTAREDLLAVVAGGAHATTSTTAATTTSSVTAQTDCRSDRRRFVGPARDRLG